MAETVKIRHPDIPDGRQVPDGPKYAEVSREAYEQLWKAKGFVEVSDGEARKADDDSVKEQIGVEPPRSTPVRAGDK